MTVSTKRAIAVALAVGLLGFSMIAFSPPASAGVAYLSLYHTKNGGWGLDAGNLTKPGPFLTYSNGTQLQLTLYSVDGQNHNFFVDYNGDKKNTSEPSSGTFSSTTGTTFSVVLNRTGNYTYRCQFHNTLTGKMNITAATGPTVTIGGLTLDTGQMILLGIVAAAAIGGIIILLRMRHRRPPLEEETEIPRAPMPRSPR